MVFMNEYPIYFKLNISNIGKVNENGHIPCILTRFPHKVK